VPRNSANTDLTSHGGCAKWYDEVNYLSEIEEHLGVTINRVAPDMAVPIDEFDGKVVYGTRRAKEGTSLNSHAIELSGVVKSLNDLEREVQLSYLSMFVKS